MKTIKIKFKDLGKSESVWNYSRKLIEEGEPEDSRLEIYRDYDEEPDLIVKNIGVSARYYLYENPKKGFEYRKWRPLPDFKTGSDGQA